MRQPVVRVARPPRRRGPWSRPLTGSGRSAPRGGRLRPAGPGPPAARPRPPTIAGTLGTPGTRPPSRSSAGQGDTQRTPVRTASTPEPAGPPQCGRRRRAPTSRGDRRVAERLRGIDDQRHLAGRRSAISRDRLGGAHLVVRGLHRRGHGAGSFGRRGELDRVDPAVASTPTDAGRAAARGMLIGGVQYRGMLDGGVHERRRPARRRQQAEHGGVQRLRAVGRKADLVRPGAETLGGRFAGGVEQQSRPGAGAVQPSRIGPAVGERRAAPRAPPGATARPTPRRGRPATTPR